MSIRLQNTAFGSEVAQTTNGSSVEIRASGAANFYVQNVVTNETPSADNFVDGVKEVSTITPDTYANTVAQDFFVLTDGDGATWGVWMNVTGVDTAPTGTVASALDNIIEADLSSLGAAEVATVTFNTQANTTHGDYFAVHAPGGETLAVYLSKDDGAAPTGTVYSNAEYKQKVDITFKVTAAQIGAAVTSVINDSSTYSALFSAVDNEDGTVTITNTEVGAASNAEVHDDDDAGAGSISVATDTAGEQTATAAEVATKIYDQIGSQMDGAFTLVDNTGSVTFTAAREAATTNAAVYDVTEVGSSSLSAATDTAGVDGSAVADDKIKISAHGYKTGLKGQLTTTDTLPTGLATSTDYYVIVVDADHIKLASSLANANAGTAVNITAAGSGTHTFTATSLAGGNLKLQVSNDGTTWIDYGSDADEDITGDETFGWTVTSYALLARVVTTLTAGQLSVTSKIVG